MMGFVRAVARVISVGFVVLLARVCVLGFVWQVARVYFVGFVHYIARVSSMGSAAIHRLYFTDMTPAVCVIVVDNGADGRDHCLSIHCETVQSPTKKKKTIGPKIMSMRIISSLFIFLLPLLHRFARLPLKPNLLVRYLIDVHFRKLRTVIQPKKHKPDREINNINRKK